MDKTFDQFTSAASVASDVLLPVYNSSAPAGDQVRRATIAELKESLALGNLASEGTPLSREAGGTGQTTLPTTYVTSLPGVSSVTDGKGFYYYGTTLRTYAAGSKNGALGSASKTKAIHRDASYWYILGDNNVIKRSGVGSTNNGRLGYSNWVTISSSYSSVKDMWLDGDAYVYFVSYDSSYVPAITKLDVANSSYTSYATLTALPSYGGSYMYNAKDGRVYFFDDSESKPIYYSFPLADGPSSKRVEFDTESLEELLDTGTYSLRGDNTRFFLDWARGEMFVDLRVRDSSYNDYRMCFEISHGKSAKQVGTPYSVSSGSSNDSAVAYVDLTGTIRIVRQDATNGYKWSCSNQTRPYRSGTVIRRGPNFINP